MTTLSPAETCRKVADIIDFESDRFDMDFWEPTSDCGTTACIAGHTALLHNDGMNQYPSFQIESRDGKTVSFLSPDETWEDKQGERLGLTPEASGIIFRDSSAFWSRHNDRRKNWRFSQVLRQLSKELDDREDGDLVDLADLEQIAEEAFS